MKFLPTDARERKDIPVYSGFVNYFPRAMAEVAKISKIGNDQHNPNTPLHWDRSKSGDELDAMMRHILEGDWGQVAWRAMANLEKELEKKACPVDGDHDEAQGIRDAIKTHYGDHSTPCATCEVASTCTLLRNQHAECRHWEAKQCQ